MVRYGRTLRLARDYVYLQYGNKLEDTVFCACELVHMPLLVELQGAMDARKA